MIKRKKHPQSRGQALVEFAIIAAGFLMLVFLIVESARILWAWGTVQAAARAGARYAVTGNFDPLCATTDIPKYNGLCPNVELRRPSSVIAETHKNLSGLPLNEDPAAQFEDMEYYNIEVFGVDRVGQIRGTNLPAPVGPEPYAGAPNQPVIVRVTYRVPIITPFFSPILPSIPVFGQTVLYNEPFGQLGGTGQSAGAPPPIPALPTPGVTPSNTPTPTPGATSTSTQTLTPTPTSTIPACPIRYVTNLVATDRVVNVTGLYANNGVPYVVTFYNLSVNGNVAIGQATMVPDTGNVHACDGFGSTTLPIGSISGGDVVEVRHPDGSSATIIVQAIPNTPTPTSTNTATPTIGPTPSGTPTVTATPTGPFIQVIPNNCAVVPASGTIPVQVFGYNWGAGASVSVFINGQLVQQVIADVEGSFTVPWTQAIANGTTYTILAQKVGASSTRSFFVPCLNVTPTPVIIPPTNTPIPADLIIGRPVIISTPPIVEYLPVDFQVAITNTGQVDVNNQFFVDVFIDPAVVYPEFIPIGSNPAYIAVDALPGGGTVVLNITSYSGFTGGAVSRQVYGMVDSLRAIGEANEINNISGPVNATVIPSTRQPTPTPNGNQVISGIVRSFVGQDYVPQNRAVVWLKNDTTGQLIASTSTDGLGYYQFINVPLGSVYTVISCLPRTPTQDHPQLYYAGERPGVTPPYLFARVNMDLSFICTANN
ncbi:MAG: pilus assembly protein [Chloroflexi bacterium]|nr:pilus assembly protein [Chloroflexota bacterium]MBK8932090.1 pilus assembly protein [Chloroflexota bacterium]